MKSMSVSRRTLLTGTVALGTVGLLAACGSSKEKVGGSAANNAEDILKNLQVNKQDRSSLKQGGTLTLAATALGPNFNLQTQSGYTSSNLDALAPCNIPAVMGFYTMSPEGEGTLNPEFCTEHKTETVNGVQTATFKINPKAAFNDGTPMDVNAVRAMWKVYSAVTDNPYHITDNTMWQQVESIEAVDGDNFHVKVTMKAPYYPSEGLCAFAIHPALEDVNLFNEGFVDKPLDQYWAGPFKVGEWNSSQKVLTLVKNDKWWGEKPILDRIIWRQMDSEAIRASFKNGELDAFTFVGATSYNAVKGQAGTEIRQSQNTNVNIIQLTPSALRTWHCAAQSSLLWTASRSLRHTSRSLAGPSRCPAPSLRCRSRRVTRTTTLVTPVHRQLARFWRPQATPSPATTTLRTARLLASR